MGSRHCRARVLRLFRCAEHVQPKQILAHWMQHREGNPEADGQTVAHLPWWLGDRRRADECEAERLELARVLAGPREAGVHLALVGQAVRLPERPAVVGVEDD